MIEWVIATLKANTVLVIFLALAIGYWVGKFKIGKFALGSVTGTLLAGVLIGQLGFDISPQVKTMFFTMFLFAVGYSVGPQFVQGVARDGLPQAIFGVVVSLLCLASVYVGAKIAGFDVGLAAGLLAGSQTISASIGLATSAINSSGVANPEALLNHIPVAYAISYLWGTVGTGMILSVLGPKLLNCDLAEECKKYEAQLSKGTPAGGMNTAWQQLQIRAYRVKDDGRGVGKKISELEGVHADERLYFERLRRDGKIIEFDGDTVIKAGDIGAISGKTEALVRLGSMAEEVADPELLDIPVESVDLVLTSKEASGKTLIELANAPFTRGVFLRKITRGATSTDVPIFAQTKVNRGDILKLSGRKSHVARVEKALGYVDRSTTATDMIWVGLFIVVFGLIGALTLKVGGVPITLSVSGGVLFGGLVLGWARSVRPTFGRLPEATQWFMNSVGLNVFIAIVGISSGPGFVAGLKANGVSLFMWGLFATSVPMLLAPLIGKYIFKFHPGINLGACGGGRTSTASAGMVADVAKSSVPMLGYTVPYAVSNTLLTLWGLVIVLIY